VQGFSRKFSRLTAWNVVTLFVTMGLFAAAHSAEAALDVFQPDATTQITAQAQAVTVGTLIIVETDAVLGAGQTTSITFDSTRVTISDHGLTVLTHGSSGLQGSIDPNTSNVTTDTAGHLRVRFRVPTATYGVHSVTAGGVSGTLFIAPRLVSVTPLRVEFGDSLTVVGDGYAAAVGITVGLWNGTLFTTDFETLTSASDGSINGSIVVGRAPGAAVTARHTVRAFETDDATHTADLTGAVAVDPSLTTTSFGDQTVGAAITVQGHGFTASSAVSATLGVLTAGVTATTGTDGSLSTGDGVAVTVPGHNFGLRALVVTAGTSVTASNAVRIIPSFTLTGTLQGTVNDTVAFSGQGFAGITNDDPPVVTTGTPFVGESVEISIIQGGAVVAPAVTSVTASIASGIEGSISGTLTLPLLFTPGIVTIQAQGANSGAVATAGFFYSDPSLASETIAVENTALTTAAPTIVFRTQAVPGRTIGVIGLNYGASTAVGNLILRKGGTEVSLTGLSEASGSGIYGAVDGSDAITTNANGVFGVTFAIPSTIEGGLWAIDTPLSAAGTAGTITINPGNVSPVGPLTPSVSSAVVGGTVTFNAAGFVRGETVTVQVGTTSVTVVDTTDGSSGDTNVAAGQIQATVTLGNQSYGDKTVAIVHSRGTLSGGTNVVKIVNQLTAVDGSAANIGTTLTKTLGSSVTVAGDGFGSSIPINLYLDLDNGSDVDDGEPLLTTVTSGSDGTFSASYTVLNAGLIGTGVFQLLIQDESVDAADQLKVAASLDFVGTDTTPISNHTVSAIVGGTFTLEGGPLTAGANLGLLRLDGAALDLDGNATAGDAGDEIIVDGQNDADATALFIRVSFTIPNLTRGAHAVTLASQPVSFTVNSSAVVSSVTDRFGSPFTGTQSRINDKIQVNLTGFGAAETVNLMVGSTIVGTTTLVVADAGKKDDVQATVPADLVHATYTLKAVAGSASVDVTTFEVVPNISITPNVGTTNTTVGVTGTGFAASESVTVTFGGSFVSFTNATATGTISTSVTVSSQFYNRSGYSLRLAGSVSGNYPTSRSFVLEAALGLATTQASTFQVGDTVLLSGTGFGDGAGVSETVAFTVGGTAPTSVTRTGKTATADGSLPDDTNGNGDLVSGGFGTAAGEASDVGIVVPALPHGTHAITAEGGSSGQREFVTISVVPSLTVTGAPVSVKRGHQITAVLQGFAAETTFQFRVGTASVNIVADQSTATDASGAATTIVSVPQLVSGAHTLIVEQPGTTSTVTGATLSAEQASAFTMQPGIDSIAGSNLSGDADNPSPVSASVGQSIQVIASGLTAGKSIGLTLGTTETAVTSNAVGADGRVVFSFTVPSIPAAAAQSVSISDDTGTLVTKTGALTTTATLSVSPTSGQTGVTELTLTATGLPAAAPLVIFTIAGQEITRASASASGDVSVTETLLPFGLTAGATNIIATTAISGGTTLATSGVFVVSAPTISASLTVSPSNGAVGTSITLTGTGFAPGISQGVTFDGVAVTLTGTGVGTVSGANVITDARGAFQVTFAAPSRPTGDRTISVGSSTGTFTIDRALTADVTSGLIAGAAVVLTGTGFDSTEDLILRMNDSSGNDIFYTYNGTLGSSGANITADPAVTLTDAVPGGAIYSSASSAGQGFRAKDDGTFTVTFVVPDVAFLGAGYSLDLLKTAGASLPSGTAPPADILDATAARGSVTLTIVPSALALGATSVRNYSLTRTSVQFASPVQTWTNTLGESDGQLAITAVGFATTSAITIDVKEGASAAATDASLKTYTLMNGSSHTDGTGSILTDDTSLIQPDLVTNIGHLTVTLVLSDLPYGEKTVFVTGSTDSAQEIVSGTFSIAPEIVIHDINGSEPAANHQGQSTLGVSVAIFGLGFKDDAAAGGEVALTIGGSSIGTGDVAADGTFDFTIATLPSAADTAIVGGANLVSTIGGAGESDTEAYSIVPRIVSVTTPVTIGATVTVNADGFRANRSVTLKIADAVAATPSFTSVAVTANGTTDARGLLVDATFAMPAHDGPQNGRVVRAATATAAAISTTTVIITPEVTSVSPVTGTTGRTVTVSGRGLSSVVSTYQIGLGAAPTAVTSLGVSTGTANGANQFTPNSQGAFTVTFAMTAQASGAVPIHVLLSSVSQASLSQFVFSTADTTGATATLVTVPTGVTVQPGDTITARGVNYPPSAIVGRIEFDADTAFGSPQRPALAKSGSGTWSVNTVTQQIFTDDNGVFEVSFAAPTGTPDSVRGAASIRTSPEFTAPVMNPTVTIQEKITRNVDTAALGSAVTITGSGFAPGDTDQKILLGTTALDGAGNVDAEFEITVTANGTFTVVVTMPTAHIADTTAGTHALTFLDVATTLDTDRDSGGESFMLTNTVAGLTSKPVSPGAGGAGTLVTVQATGFANGTAGVIANAVSVEYDGAAISSVVDLVDGNTKHLVGAVTADTTLVNANAAGEIQFTFNVPPSGAGTRVIRLQQAADFNSTGNDALDLGLSFTVSGLVSVQPTSGQVGDALVISGAGFDPNASVSLSFGSTTGFVTGTTNSIGSFNIETNAVEQPKGSVTVRASTISTAGSSAFTIAERTTLNGATAAVSAIVGETTTVGGDGFPASTAVDVTLGNGQSVSLSTNGLGTVSNAFVLAATSSDVTYTTQVGTITGPVLTVTPTVWLGVASGKVGDQPIASGTGLHKDATVTVQLGNNAAGTPVDATPIGIAVGDDGSFTETLTIGNVVPGTGDLLVVTATLGSSPAAQPFTITGSGSGLTVQNSTQTADLSAGTVGIALVIAPALATFGAGEAISLFFGGQPLSDFGISIVPVVDSTGRFVASFAVPAIAGGSKQIRAVGLTTTEEQTATFRVDPNITSISPIAFEFDETVTLTGNGSGASDALQVQIAPVNTDRTVATDEASNVTITSQSVGADGVYSLTFIVPSRVLASASTEIAVNVTSVSAGLESGFLRLEELGVAPTIVTKGVRLALSQTAGSGDATLTLTGFATDNVGALRVVENIGPIRLRPQTAITATQVPEADLTILTGGNTGNSIITDGTAKFEVMFLVGTAAEPVPGGNLSIEIAGESILYAVIAELTVLNDAGTVMSDVQLDTQYALRGAGYFPNQPVTVTLDGAALATTTSTETDDFGVFTTQFTLTDVLGGAHSITAASGSGTFLKTATATPRLVGTITSPATVPVAAFRGDTVEIAGRGFGSEEALTFSIGPSSATTVANGTSAADGSFASTVTIPAVPAGTHDLIITSASTIGTIDGAFVVGSSIIVVEASGSVGAHLTVAGNGFGAAETVTIAIPGQADTAVTSDSIGSFEVTIALGSESTDGTSITVSASSASVTPAVTDSFTYDGAAVVQNITASPSSAAAGTAITVTAEVESGATATFSIAGVAGATDVVVSIDDAATPPDGFDSVTGSYMVIAGDDVADAALTVSVTDGFGNTATITADVTVSLDNTAPAIDSSSADPSTVRSGLSFVITVTTETGATVSADVSTVDTTQTDAVALEETADAGVYAATIVISGDNEAETGEKTVTISVTDAAGNAVTDTLTITYQAKTDFTVSLHTGVNMIHVPVKDEGIALASDLFDRLGGEDFVSVIVMVNDQGKFAAFTPSVAVGSRADVPLGDATAAIVVMKQARQQTFTGGVLSDSVDLTAGLNLVGVTRSGAVDTIADLAALSDDVSVVIREEEGRFVSYPPDSADITGGQGYIVVATAATTLTLDGQPWQNTAAAAPISNVVYNSSSTPVFVLEGALVREDNLATVNGLDVTVTSLRTGEVVSDVGGRAAGNGRFATTFLRLSGGEYGIGDTFELRIDDPSGTFGGVPTVRHTITAEDVRRGRFNFESILLSVVPDQSALLANYPNPFNPETWIPFQLSVAASVRVTIYDAAGERVRALDVGYLPAGTYTSRSKSVYWDGSNETGEPVASGLYFYRIEADSFSAMRRMVILK